MISAGKMTATEFCVTRLTTGVRETTMVCLRLTMILLIDIFLSYIMIVFIIIGHIK